VAAGAVLVTLDDASAAVDVAAARAALGAAAARADQADAAARQADAEVARASAAVRAARAARDRLPGSASRAQERQADAEVDAARAGVTSAQAARDAARAAAAAAEADTVRAQAALDAAEVAQARLVVTTPIDGTVAEVTVEPGDVIGTGSVLARIAGGAGWQFETTDLAQDEVAAVEVGAPASVTLDGFADTRIEGRVARIAAVGEDSQGDVVFTVVIEPTGEVPEGIRWNMLASAEISTAP
jgi:multidrug resistance efflux pump